MKEIEIVPLKKKKGKKRTVPMGGETPPSEKPL